MRKHAATESIEEMRSEDRKQVNQYRNVQFLGNGFNATYRLKILNKSSKSLCFLVKENSDILPRLKIGGQLEMIYYPLDSLYPCVYLAGVVRHITKRYQGRFKGNHLVGLEALKRQHQGKAL